MTSGFDGAPVGRAIGGSVLYGAALLATALVFAVRTRLSRRARHGT